MNLCKVVKLCCPPIILNVLKKLVFRRTLSEMYSIDGMNLDLGKNHKLPQYQKEFSMYDRINPFLAYFSGGGGIIDIGANVGDMLMAMLKHTDSRFLCIEPNNEFYGLLKKILSPYQEIYQTELIFKKYLFLELREKIIQWISIMELLIKF